MNNENLSNFLVLGNGFDIHHDLKTSYADFINFCNVEENIEKLVNKFPNDVYIDIYGDNKQYDIKECANGNLWFNLINRYTTADNKWCQLEDIIKEVVEKLDLYTEKQKTGSLRHNYIGESSDTVSRFILGNILYGRSVKAFEDFSRQLELDLRKLIFLLQKYLLFTYGEKELVVDNDMLELIKNGYISHVLSFNYTTTIEDLYLKDTSDIKVCHIHGTLDNYKTMVLGTCLDNEYSNNELFIPFQKCHQEIIKNSDRQYEKWQLNYKYAYTIFYGFSFGLSDKEEIQELYDISNAFYIYYHNEKALNDININLNKILGKDKYIKGYKEGRIQYFDSLSNEEFKNRLFEKAFEGGLYEEE